MNKYSLLLLILLVIIAVLLIKYFKSRKKINIGALCLITGGVKSGKTSLAVYLAFNEYRKRIFNFYFKKIFFPKKNINIEKPLLYSNVPLKCSYVPLTKDLLLRKKRFAYNSVIYVCEASLVADNMLFKDMVLNDKLLFFNKLIAHETKGGCLIYDTQSLQDVHYTIKRSVSNFIYINSLNKGLPFILRANVKEYINLGEDSNVFSINNDDLENEMKYVYFPKAIWKKFDCYCYSTLTDNLEVEKNVINNKNGSLKVDKIISFRNRSVENEK